MLCWLATVSAEGIPNVSPKETFAAFKDEAIIVANIASPNTVKNIKQNQHVCISFIDVFVQKGMQLHGIAEIIEQTHPNYDDMKTTLSKILNDKFPFSSITKISVGQAKPIIAPSYRFFPDTTEAQQVESATKAYGL